MLQTDPTIVAARLVWANGSDVPRGSLGFCGHSANWPWTLTSDPSPRREGGGGKQSSEWHMKLDTLWGESVWTGLE